VPTGSVDEQFQLVVDRAGAERMVGVIAVVRVVLAVERAGEH